MRPAKIVVGWNPETYGCLIEGVGSIPSYRNADDVPAGVVSRVMGELQYITKAETEDFLRTLTSQWQARREELLWRRDYSSESAYITSVEPNRRRWQQAVGDLSALEVPEPEGDVEWEPFFQDNDIEARWISVPVGAGLRVRAVLALPKGKSGPFPVVLTQHGVTGSPEKTFGYDDPGGYYSRYSAELVRAGYAVLAPKNLSMKEVRGRMQRLCLMLGITLWGLEIYKLQRLLDAVLALDEIDEERLAMWGLSLGGAYTQFMMPLEPRIKVGITSGFFNDRYRKMVIDDPRYSCFLSTIEEHVFIPRWLVEFGDEDLVSLVCPRPFQIQTGKSDAISWWPFVQETFERSKEHYVKLGAPDAIEFDLHEGGHEIRLESGMRFLKRWL